MTNHRADTATIIAALRILANDIQSQDGVPNAVVGEAADRLEEHEQELNGFEDLVKELEIQIDSVSRY